MSDVDWMGEAKKSGLSAAEVAAERLVESQEETNAAFVGLFDAIRLELEKLKRGNT